MRPADVLREITQTVPAALDGARLGTVTSTTGGLFLMFDGEVVASSRSYKRLTSYTPTVGDRVLVVRVGSTWIVAGELA